MMLDRPTAPTAHKGSQVRTASMRSTARDCLRGVAAELHFQSRRFNLQQYKGRGWGQKSNVYLPPVPFSGLHELEFNIGQRVTRPSSRRSED